MVAMHGLSEFLTDLITSAVSAWQRRSEVARTYFVTAAEKKRALRRATLYCAALTTVAVLLIGAMTFLLWWAFTIHTRWESS